jgi:hypothetical protein
MAAPAADAGVRNAAEGSLVAIIADEVRQGV